MKCVFCEDNYGSIIKTELSLFNRKIYEDEHWMIYPTLGAFVEGYVLHVLKRHTLSSLFCSDEEITNLSKNIQLIESLYLKAYNTRYSYIFEHGTREEEYCNTCCIAHTHLHMLPASVDVMSSVVESIHSPMYRASTLLGCYRVIEEQKLISYMLFGETTSNSYFVIDGDEGLYPSQYMRMIMYKSLLNRPLSDYGWDWRKKPHYKNIIRTKDTMKKYLSHENIIVA